MDITDDEIEEARQAIFHDRVTDLHGWLVESFTEAPDELLFSLSKAALAQDTQAIGLVAQMIIEAYNMVDNDTAAEYVSVIRESELIDRGERAWEWENDK